MTVAKILSTYPRVMPERLRRLEHHFQRCPIYFITASTYQRERILDNGRVHTSFIEFAQTGPQHGAWIGSYVLMPDHLHVFVVMEDERLSLSTWVKSLKNAISKTLRQDNVPSPHWQKGFFDHVLRSTESYSEKWDYVRQNPKRAGLVNDWGDWSFWGTIFDLEFRSDRH